MASAGLAEVRRIGPFAVETRPEAVAAFRRETGWPEDAGSANTHVPVTFAFCWLTLPEIRPALLQAMMPGEDWIPVHEGQTFDYARMLETGQTYSMVVDIHREAKPARLVMRASITSLADEPCAVLETVLRLVVRNNPEPSPEPSP
jgi:hypothetical protein